MGRTTPDAAKVAFTEKELLLLDGCHDREREAWLLRLWCAKEACAKAVGKGFGPGLHAFAVRELDWQSGRISVRFDTRETAPLDLVALTAQDGDWIVATCAATTEENVRL